MSNEFPLLLSVDDERANLVLLERLLNNYYRVLNVSSGEEALDMLVQAPFDLILLDVMMPGMNGLETLQRIRENPNTADIPVILISALSDVRDVTRGLELGANDYITKPIDMDITLARIQTQLALKQLQDERKQTIAELKATQEMKTRLLRIASHDLKAPMMNIHMVNMILRDFVKAIPDGKTLLDATDTSLETMHMVIKDFLDTAALEVSALDIYLNDVELEPLITALFAEHKINATRKNIVLETGDLTGVIHADKARFQQALGNIISNAVKYSPFDTTVTVWTEHEEGAVRVYVADQGPGIPPEDRGRLFTQFGKLTPRPTGGEASTGLGLWIVKHLVNLQGGDVGLISPPEGGSIFWIRMPAAS